MKATRQETILALIERYDISTQEELTARLNELGYKTTQATVSRDVKKLELRKVPAGGGGQKYIRPGVLTRSLGKYHRIVAEGMLSAQPAGTIVVVKTSSGMAMAVAAALEELEFPEAVGCIAGDDTIMCACRCIEDAQALTEKIQSLTDTSDTM